MIIKTGDWEVVETDHIRIYKDVDEFSSIRYYYLRVGGYNGIPIGSCESSENEDAIDKICTSFIDEIWGRANSVIDLTWRVEKLRKKIKDLQN